MGGFASLDQRWVGCELAKLAVKQLANLPNLPYLRDTEHIHTSTQKTAMAARVALRAAVPVSVVSTARTAVVAPRRKRRRMTARCLGSRTPGLSFSCLRGRGLGRRGWRQNSTANAPLRTHPCLPASGEQPPSRAQERIRGGAAGIQLRAASEARATVAARHSG